MIVAKNQAVPLCNRIDGAFCKQTRRNTAPDAADAVAAERIQSIIIAKLCLDNRNGKIANRADQTADDKRRPQRYKACARRDGNQSQHTACARTDQRRLAVSNHINEHPCQHCHCRRDVCGQERMCCQTVRLQCTAGIEAKPAKPQQRCAEHNKRNIVRQEIALLAAQTLAENQGQHQAGNTGADVHNIAARKVNRTDCRQEAALAPYHVRQRIIHNQ